MGQAQSGPKITAQDRAILDMKLQRDKLKQYQKKIQVVFDREHTMAAEALKVGQKQKALTALRRRKYQEGLLQKTDAQLEVLENLVSSIEFALVEKDVMFGLRQGNEVLKQLHSEMSIESVEKLMADTADAIAYQREIDEMLVTHMSADEEEAVQRELAELQREALGLPAVPEVAPLPNVPHTAPAQATEEPVLSRDEGETSKKVALEA